MSSRRRRGWTWFVVGVVVYLLVAYVVAPAWWKRYERRHPWFDDNPHVTQTADRHPGDPLNVGLIGSLDDVRRCMLAAGWYSADPLGLRSDVRIGVDTVLKRPYDSAPVSKLFLFGRMEDLAFEQPVADNPRRRHHVRFWKLEEADADGRPRWIGSASYDRSVGLSHTTGQITHHIAGDVDAERDHVLTSLQDAGQLIELLKLPNFQEPREGRNGGGDHWQTDGALWLGRLVEGPVGE